MKIETLSYSDGETNFLGYLADPEGSGRRPGVLVVHEAPGLNDHPKRRARMLAELGYVALAADLYGDGRVAQKPEESAQLMAPLREDIPRLRRRTRAALDALSKLRQVDPARLGAMGYCFGGLAVLELARTGAPVAGTVSFHGILSTKTPEDAKNIRGKILACTGADDPLVPPDQIAGFEHEMTQAGIDWQVIKFGGAKHAFTNPDANRPPVLAYQAAADARSWDAMQGFWFEIFGKP
ncbi:MAG TPA: dienelactone hydrolase family protein [Stellaceae bacterium]|nr:dienelactone hydrolase family protein [Stellaceae bacterium]